MKVYVLHEPQCCGETVLHKVFLNKRVGEKFMEMNKLTEEYYELKEFEVIQ